MDADRIWLGSGPPGTSSMTSLLLRAQGAMPVALQNTASMNCGKLR